MSLLAITCIGKRRLGQLGYEPHEDAVQVVASDTQTGSLVSTMGLIRVGFFEDFKGADTLLIDVDAEGLRGLIAWLRDVILSGRRVLLSDCPGVSLQSGLQVEAFPSRDDTGLLKSGEGAFVWQRSEEGWTDIVEKLGAMGTGAGHQYLDGPRDDVQVMASFGEYGDEWWNRHGH